MPIGQVREYPARPAPGGPVGPAGTTPGGKAAEAEAGQTLTPTPGGFPFSSSWTS